jgi:hypothetical protein
MTLRTGRPAAIGRALPVILFGILSTSFVFRYQINEGFHRVFSDTYDGFIEIALLEHWNNVLHGAAHWSSPFFFFPEQDALGYNDGYFIYGIVYSMFRWSGLDPFLSSELVNMTIRAAGYAAFYLAGRRIFHLDRPWAVFAAVLFTISNNAFIHMIHQQLLAVALVPAMALLLQATLQALRAGRPGKLLLAGGGFVVFYAAWLMTSFYMAWFFAYATLAFGLAWGLLAPPGRRRDILQSARRQVLPLLALLVLAVIVNAPFFALYLPKAGETGMHPFSESMIFSPSLLDLVHVGAGNLLFGGLDQTLRQHVHARLPDLIERTTGFPPVILTLFGLALCWLWRRQADSGDRLLFLRALAGSVVVSWALLAHVGGITAYALVYDGLPGARAIRVLARYQILLAAPLIGLAMVYLSHRVGRWPTALVLCLGCLLLAEQINIAPPLRIDRSKETARLAAVPPAPTACQAFFISHPDPAENVINPETDGIFRHSVDAMLIAELLRLPTVNGYASFTPPGYDLLYPDRSDYLTRLKSYAAWKGLHQLCGLDLRNDVWTADAL